jgi:lipopolysaccharide/colanic/teichoic acid biosynthesis glycosyltransferase
MFPRTTLEDALKRACDVALSAAALSALGIPLMAIGVAIKLDSPGPAIYRGQRVGLRGRLFKLLKFRSMVVNADKGASTTSGDDPRVTRVGRFLRTYKLDELPQLINVLLGDMSIVGPRPQVKWVVDGFSQEELHVLEVRPGITDWASIEFHNEGEIVSKSGIADPDEAYFKLIHPEKMRLQLEYVRRRSFVTDVRIIFETIATLVRTRTGTGEEQSEPASRESRTSRQQEARP